MNNKEFRQQAHQFVDWMADYLENLEQLPVKPNIQPGSILQQLPQEMPTQGEAMQHIFEDFQKIILPGMTHWQHPGFMAYFPANNSYPSILGEMLMATMGAQCMIWETSPAAAELEEAVMIWLKKAMHLPSSWEGCIQDTASAATLCALLSAREQISQFQINKEGIQHNNYRTYCSTQTHSSIDKAVKIAGLGLNNLVKVAVDEQLALDPQALEQAITDDLKAGRTPMAVVAALGTTSTTAIDNIEEVAHICRKYNVWLHVDAAYAGSVLVLPEYQWMIRGLEHADSFVFNPHKWLFTNFDCSAYFVKSKETLLKTFSILPEYLKTQSRGQVNDYRDWGVALGRRFRALKLWFVLRNFGLEGLQRKLREHLSLAKKLEEAIEVHPNFELLIKPQLNLLCFRYRPKGYDVNKLNKLNEDLLQQLNQSGKIYLSHTKINGQYALRFVAGQTYLQEEHIWSAWELIQQTAKDLQE